MNQINILTVLIASGGIASCTEQVATSTCPSSAPNLVRVGMFGVPLLYTYRDGQGPWLPPVESGDPGIYDICVNQDYRVSVVCEGSNSTFNAIEYAATFSDGANVTLGPCGSEFPVDSSPKVSVTGQMLQAGQVFMNNDTRGYTTGPWSFDMSIPTGIHSFVASDDFDLVAGIGRAAVRRDQTIQSPTTEADVDLDVEGTVLTAHPLNVTNPLADDLFTTQVVFIANDEASTISRTSTPSAHLLPPDVLEVSDLQVVSLTAFAVGSRPNIVRSVEQVFDDSTTSITLPPALTGVTFEQATVVSAAWPALPVTEYSYIEFNVYGKGSTQQVHATKSWIDQQGENSLGFDISPPEYDLSWVLPVPNSRYLVLVNDTPDVRSATSLLEVNNPLHRLGPNRSGRKWHGASRDLTFVDP